ncbi:LysR substrate-binding domain-containing protein [Glutamicibacter sp. NPDC090743]|uniref:LysR substrate-binding domain-containing protein n=1 Tax=Glutamicibacter sp. NPDC090743 TaxID=3364001 RepID=UPI00380C58BC
MMRYTLRQIECLRAVGQYGSIAAAAQALMLSASAVSGALNELDRAFNTQLTVRRKAHGVSLTASGEYVLTEGRNLLQLAEDLDAMAAEAGAVLRGRVRIGCYQSLAPTVLVELLDEYLKRYPQVQVDFFAGTQEQIHRKLQAGELDLAVVYDFGMPDGLKQRVLQISEPVVVLPPAHPLAQQPKIALAQLVSEPMILLDVQPSREHTNMLFAAAGLTPWIRYRTTDFEATRSMVARNMGYAILIQRPQGDRSYEGKELAVRGIHPVVSKVRVCLVSPEALRPSRAVAAMHELAVALH